MTEATTTLTRAVVDEVISVMDRRTFIGSVASGLLAVPFVALA